MKMYTFNKRVNPDLKSRLALGFFFWGNVLMVLGQSVFLSESFLPVAENSLAVQNPVENNAKPLARKHKTIRLA